MYKFYNANPCNKRVGDCVIRAIATALNKLWEDVYIELSLFGYSMCDLPSSNAVWHKFLKEQGFTRNVIPDTCPDCYTINQFCEEHPKGTYILGTGTHTVCVIDGVLLDTWDSSQEIPIYFWNRKEDLKNGKL